MSTLTGKQVVLGVTGSIAAYKAVYLARLFVEAEAGVWPIMTQAATQFVGPLTFSAITGHRVVTDMWSAALAGEIGHVELAHRADVLIIAPASADTIARLASGRADEPLAAVALSTRAPWVVAPAMEEGMWLNAATQQNIAALQARGARIVGPASGALASGRSGIGRMAAPEEIFAATLAALTPQDLAKQRLVITAGPTREPFDPARFLSNPSTGKMGYALARQARRRGADVVLVSGPVALEPPYGVEVIRVETTTQMLEATSRALTGASALVMAAAPVDFKPAHPTPHKRKKGESGEPFTVELDSNPDILRALGARARGIVAVGFAAETNDLIANARRKLESKDLDLVAANDINDITAGFAVDRNQVTLISREGEPVALPSMPKDEVANAILDRVAALIAQRCDGHVDA